MSRARVVLVLVTSGLITFVVSLLTWVEATTTTALGPQAVQVSGATAAPVVPSAALVVAVAGLAMGLSGRVVRILAPAAAVLAATVALVALIGLLTDPGAVARSAAGDVGGVREISGAADLTWWPWLAAVLLGLTVVIAAALPFLAGRWAPAARKYERPGAPEGAGATPHTPRSDWDALSSGIDPSAADPADEHDSQDHSSATDHSGDQGTGTGRP